MVDENIPLHHIEYDILFDCSHILDSERSNFVIYIVTIYQELRINF